MSCKLYLVPEDVIQTWKNEQRIQQVDKPVETTLGKIDNNMQSILSNNSISDYDKEKLYTQKLGTYVDMRDRMAPPMHSTTSTPTSTATFTSSSPTTSNTAEFHDILSTVPKIYRPKADTFLKYLQSDKDISWDDKGQLILKGKLIPKSHVVDLMHDSLRLRKKVKRAKGWRELSHHLVGKNIPHEIIGNETWSTLPDSPVKKKTPVRFTFTPGKPRKSKVIGRKKIRDWIKILDES